MADNKLDFYEVLGIGKDASREDIKSAYKLMARKYHPDLNPDDPKAKEKFQEVGEAYDVLSNPDKKARYDRKGAVDNSATVAQSTSTPSQSSDLKDILANLGSQLGKSIDDALKTSYQSNISVKKNQLKNKYLGELCFVSEKHTSGYDKEFINLINQIRSSIDAYNGKNENAIHKEIVKLNSNWLKNYCTSHNLELKFDENGQCYVANIKLDVSSLANTYRHLLYIETYKRWNSRYNITKKGKEEHPEIVNNLIINRALNNFQTYFVDLRNRAAKKPTPRVFKRDIEDLDWLIKQCFNDFLNDYCQTYGLGTPNVNENGTLEVYGQQLDINQRFLKVCLQLEKIRKMKDMNATRVREKTA